MEKKTEFPPDGPVLRGPSRECESTRLPGPWAARASAISKKVPERKVRLGSGSVWVAGGAAAPHVLGEAVGLHTRAATSSRAYERPPRADRASTRAAGLRGDLQDQATRPTATAAGGAARQPSEAQRGLWALPGLTRAGQRAGAKEQAHGQGGALPRKGRDTPTSHRHPMTDESQERDSLHRATAAAGPDTERGERVAWPTRSRSAWSLQPGAAPCGRTGHAATALSSLGLSFPICKLGLTVLWEVQTQYRATAGGQRFPL